MKPFIRSQRELLQKADKALELIERKMRIAYECKNSMPRQSEKLQKAAEKHLAEYEQAKAELQASWAEEVGVMCHREDSVTIAESFNWHPTENMQ